MVSLLSYYRTKKVWVFEHLVFFMGPMYFMFTQPDNKIFQYAMLIFTINYLVIITTFAGATPSSIGLQRKYFLSALKFIFLPTIIFAAIILWIRYSFPTISVSTHKSLTYFLEYILISVPLQEIVFRGFCVYRCKLSFNNTAFLVVFNAFMFAMYHMIVQNIYFTTGLFLINLFWSYAYLKYPNLYVFMLSHTFIGLIYFW